MADWERAIELDTGHLSQFYRSRIGLSVVRMGDHVHAVREAKALADAVKENGLVLNNVACIYSLSAAATAQDKSLEQTKRAKLATEYALHAIDLLKRAQAAGFFKDPTKIEHMKKDADLDPIREHEEFKKLLREIEADFRAKQKKKSTKLPLIAPRPKLVALKPRG